METVKYEIDGNLNTTIGDRVKTKQDHKRKREVARICKNIKWHQWETYNAKRLKG